MVHPDQSLTPALRFEKWKLRQMLKHAEREQQWGLANGVSHAVQNILTMALGNPVTAYVLGWGFIDLLEKLSFGQWPDEATLRFPFMDRLTAGRLKTAIGGFAAAYAAAPLAAAALPGLLALTRRDVPEVVTPKRTIGDGGIG